MEKERNRSVPPCFSSFIQHLSESLCSDAFGKVVSVFHFPFSSPQNPLFTGVCMYTCANKEKPSLFIQTYCCADRTSYFRARLHKLLKGLFPFITTWSFFFLISESNILLSKLRLENYHASCPLSSLLTYFLVQLYSSVHSVHNEGISQSNQTLKEQ